MMGFTMGACAIRMVIKGLAHDVGDLSFGAFVAIMGVSIGTLMTLLIYLIPAIVLCMNRSRANNGADTFIAGRGGFYWNGSFFNFDPVNSTCWTGVTVLEDRRVKVYQQGMAPCLEFCTSVVTKNGANYHFHRIPIPPNRVEEAQAYVNSTLAQTGNDRSVWGAHLTGYALELEVPV